MDINHGLLMALGVSNEALDKLVYAAKRGGALGAKLTGAGGGGCMVALTSFDMREAVAQVISEVGGTPIIAEKVNSSLQPVIRTHSRPTQDPLTLTEIKAIEEDARPIEVEPEITQKESEISREFNRKVERFSRSLYLRLLERGRDGSTLEEIASEAEFEDVSLPVLKSAINKLVKGGLVTELSQERYAVSSAFKVLQGKTYEVTIEKIYPGVAVVRVNDKWRARLTPEERRVAPALYRALIKGQGLIAAGEKEAMKVTTTQYRRCDVVKPKGRIDSKRRLR
jgi:hypothetical protein